MAVPQWVEKHYIRTAYQTGLSIFWGALHKQTMIMIPDFDENGNLPPGVHFCSWDEFNEKFGYTRNRRQVIQGMDAVMSELKTAGCKVFYINGSFVTSEPSPRDFDACWDRDAVDIEYLQQNAPLILNFYQSKAQKSKLELTHFNEKLSFCGLLPRRGTER
jgi:hypothetical protein